MFRSLIFLSIFAASCVAYATDFPEHEPNNSFPPGASLGLLSSGDRIVGDISSSSDVDWHYFDTLGTGSFGLYRYTFTTQIPAGKDSILMIFDSNPVPDPDFPDSPKYVLNYNDDAVPGVAAYSRCEYDMFTNGQNVRWGAFIEGFTSQDVWAYGIQATWEKIIPVDVGAYAPGNIVLDTTKSAEMDDTEIVVFDANGNMVAYNDDIDGTHRLSHLEKNLASGDYYICLTSAAAYLPTAGQDRTGVGPGDLSDGAYTLTINGTDYNGSITIGSANWYIVHIGNPKTISGTVTLEAIKGDPATVAVTFEIREQGTQNVLQSTTKNLNSDGSYSFSTSLTGTVDIAAKGPVYLRSKQTVDLSGSTSGIDFELTAGDTTGDNVVDLKDISPIFVYFETTGLWTEGDINGDAIVDIFDLNLPFLHFGESGAP